VYRERTIAAVVPAFREEDRIAGVIRTMPAIVDHIVIVDDHSPDGTGDTARAVNDSRVEVIRHEENQGVGGAIVTGHRRAMELGADVDVVMAGDGQMDPAYLPALLDPIVDEGYGFTKANRFFSTESFRGMPKHRVFGNIILSFFTKLASGYWHLFDPQNGYTAVTTDALRRINLDSLARRYEFENDLLINLNILGVRARDVDVPAVYGDEVSGIRLPRVAPAITWLLFRGFWKRMWIKYVLRSFSPVALLFFTGLGLVGFGGLVGIWVLTQTIGSDAASTGTVLLSVAPFLVGMNFLVQALVLDIQESPD